MVTFVLLPVFGNVTKNRHIQSCFYKVTIYRHTKWDEKPSQTNVTVFQECFNFPSVLHFSSDNAKDLFALILIRLSSTRRLSRQNREYRTSVYETFGWHAVRFLI